MGWSDEIRVRGKGTCEPRYQCVDKRCSLKDFYPVISGFYFWNAKALKSTKPVRRTNKHWTVGVSVFPFNETLTKPSDHPVWFMNPCQLPLSNSCGGRGYEIFRIWKKQLLFTCWHVTTACFHSCSSWRLHTHREQHRGDNHCESSSSEMQWLSCCSVPKNSFLLFKDTD